MISFFTTPWRLLRINKGLVDQVQDLQEEVADLIKTLDLSTRNFETMQDVVNMQEGIISSQSTTIDELTEDLRRANEILEQLNNGGYL